VEAALVTGSFLFIGQADNATEAQQHAAQLYTTGTAPNTALTTDIAAVFQSWLTSNVTAYVEEMTAALGTSTAVVAAVDVLELGLFSSVLVSDVTVLNATIDQNATAALVVNSSNAVQNCAYNVTLQVTVLTADMLLSVFVDVVNTTSSRRRLMSSSESIPLAWQSQLDSTLLSPDHMLARPDYAATSKHSPGNTLADSLQHLWDLADDLSVASCSTESSVACLNSSHTQPTQLAMANSHSPAEFLHPAVPASVHSMLHIQQQVLQGQAHVRSLQSTASSSAFPLVSLLTFKINLMLAAFNGTSGCNTTSVTDLFYEDSETPTALSELCGTDGGTADLSMNQALLASVNSSVPLLQVRYADV